MQIIAIEENNKILSPDLSKIYSYKPVNHSIFLGKTSNLTTKVLKMTNTNLPSVNLLICLIHLFGDLYALSFLPKILPYKLFIKFQSNETHSRNSNKKLRNNFNFINNFTFLFGKLLE